MKIFLKILGIIFTILITGLLSSILFVIFCDCNINTAIWLLSEGSGDTYATVAFSLGFGIFFCFCPIWFEINKKIDNRF